MNKGREVLLTFELLKLQSVKVPGWGQQGLILVLALALALENDTGAGFK
jgi:hypothetical protein